MVGSKHSDRGFEVVQRVEGLVDAREPEVRHLVELSERSEDCQADLVRVNLRAPARADRLLDPLGQQSKVVLADRPALARLAHAGDDFVPTEGLAHAGALYDRQARCLDRRESAVARRALPAATNSRAVIRSPGVDDARVAVPTEGAMHRAPPKAARHVAPTTYGERTPARPLHVVTTVERTPCARNHGRRRGDEGGAAPQPAAGTRICWPARSPAFGSELSCMRSSTIARMSSAGVAMAAAMLHRVSPGTTVWVATAVASRGSWALAHPPPTTTEPANTAPMARKARRPRLSL